MTIKPRYLILAAIAAGGLYAFGVSVGTVIFVFALAYMASMHLGHRGGHGGGKGGHGGGCGGHADNNATSDINQTLSWQQPPVGTGHLGDRCPCCQPGFGGQHRSLVGYSCTRVPQTGGLS